VPKQTRRSFRITDTSITFRAATDSNRAGLREELQCSRCGLSGLSAEQNELCREATAIDRGAKVNRRHRSLRGNLLSQTCDRSHSSSVADTGVLPFFSRLCKHSLNGIQRLGNSGTHPELPAGEDNSANAARVQLEYIDFACGIAGEREFQAGLYDTHAIRASAYHDDWLTISNFEPERTGICDDAIGRLKFSTFKVTCVRLPVGFGQYDR